MRVILAVLASWLLATGGAAAQSQPVAGKLFFAHDLDRPVMLKIEGRAVGTAGPMGVLEVELKAGTYRLTTEPSGGGSQTGTWTLRSEDLATARGGRYWCLYLDARQTLVIVPRDLCIAYVEAPN